MKYLLLTALPAALILSACTTVPVDPNATPAQVAAAEAAQKQADFNAVCKYGTGAWQLAKPVVSTPVVAAKIGDSGQLVLKALDAFVTTTCASPLDITNADALIQRGYDIAGQVIAMVIQAEAT